MRHYTESERDTVTLRDVPLKDTLSDVLFGYTLENFYKGWE